MNILHLLTIFGLPTRMSLFGPDKIWNDYWRKLNGLNLPTMSSEKAGVLGCGPIIVRNNY